MEELRKRIVISLFGLMGLSPLALGCLGPGPKPVAPAGGILAQDLFVLPSRRPAAPGGAALPWASKNFASRKARRTLRLLGSQLCIDFAGKPLARSFRDAQAELELEFEHRRERDAIEQVIGGSADLALVSVGLTDFERGYGVQERIIAYLLPALIAHTNNPVGNLQRQDVWRLLSGKLDSWADLGGQNGDLQGLLAGPMSLVQSQKLTMMPGHEFLSDWPMLSAAQVYARVAANPLALGVTHLAGIDSGVRTLAIDGVFPTVHGFREGRYPFGHAFRVVFRVEREADVETFLKFLESKAGLDCLAHSLVLPM